MDPISFSKAVQVSSQLADKANQADLTALDTRVDTIITTPAESVSAQEIIDARQGAATLGANIEALKTDYATQVSQLMQNLVLNGNFTVCETKDEFFGKIAEIV
jgi:hypothetical protein